MILYYELIIFYMDICVCLHAQGGLQMISSIEVFFKSVLNANPIQADLVWKHVRRKGYHACESESFKLNNFTNCLVLFKLYIFADCY